jgi:uncharacterized protein YqkB
MMRLLLSETISAQREICAEVGSLNELLMLLAVEQPKIFDRIATKSGGLLKLKSFITVFINEEISFDTNPSLSADDCISFELAISGG